MQRKINIIIYLSQDWNPEWGGNLGLWSHNSKTNRPDKMEKQVICKFNRAAIFDTTQNSWHGLPSPLTCPDNQSRKSIAVYYLQTPEYNASERVKALFAPSEEQEGNSEIEELIKIRSNIETASNVYK
jgi:Rps23 Pro-64 3,4-dihydroxylase Tpa1-like proline 4-hydroxylase